LDILFAILNIFLEFIDLLEKLVAEGLFLFNLLDETFNTLLELLLHLALGLLDLVYLVAQD
jgi:hypothetical protein